MKTKAIIAAGLVTLALLAGCNKAEEPAATSAAPESAPSAAPAPAEAPPAKQYKLCPPRLGAVSYKLWFSLQWRARAYSDKNPKNKISPIISTPGRHWPIVNVFVLKQ